MYIIIYCDGARISNPEGPTIVVMTINFSENLFIIVSFTNPQTYIIYTYVHFSIFNNEIQEDNFYLHR